MPAPHHWIFYRLDALSGPQTTVSKAALMSIINLLHSSHHNHHNRFTALFPVPLGWAGARRELRTLWCKGRLIEADTLTIRLGATPSGLTSAHLHHPPFVLLQNWQTAVNIWQCCIVVLWNSLYILFCHKLFVVLEFKNKLISSATAFITLL